jgi:hypothetical protein
MFEARPAVLHIPRTGEGIRRLVRADGTPDVSSWD